MSLSNSFCSTNSITQFCVLYNKNSDRHVLIIEYLSNKVHSFNGIQLDHLQICFYLIERWTFYNIFNIFIILENCSVKNIFISCFYQTVAFSEYNFYICFFFQMLLLKLNFWRCTSEIPKWQNSHHIIVLLFVVPPFKSKTTYNCMLLCFLWLKYCYAFYIRWIVLYEYINKEGDLSFSLIDGFFKSDS